MQNATVEVVTLEGDEIITCVDCGWAYCAGRKMRKLDTGEFTCIDPHVCKRRISGSDGAWIEEKVAKCVRYHAGSIICTTDNGSNVAEVLPPDMSVSEMEEELVIRRKYFEAGLRE